MNSKMGFERDLMKKIRAEAAARRAAEQQSQASDISPTQSGQDAVVVPPQKSAVCRPRIK